MHAARWGQGTDADRARLILERLRGETLRSARFESTVAMAFPDGSIRTAMGAVHGVISEQRIGEESMGYTAIFVTDGGQIPSNDAVPPAPHRLQALERAAEVMLRWTAGQG